MWAQFCQQDLNALLDHAFAISPERDLLRPTSDQYVGISSTGSVDQHNERESDKLDDIISSLHETSANDPEVGITHSPPKDFHGPLTNNRIFEDACPDVEIEDFLPDDYPNNDDSIEQSLTHTFMVDGKVVRIDPIVSTLCPDRWRRVSIRVLRAQGRLIEEFTKAKQDALESPNSPETHLMKVADLGAVLVRSGGELCIAVIEVSGFLFSNGKEQRLRTVAKYSELITGGSNGCPIIRILGQITAITHTTQTVWEWQRRYLELDTSLVGARQMTRNRLTLEVPSALVHPISPAIVSQIGSVTTRDLRWSITSEDLQQALEIIWARVTASCSSTVSVLQLVPQTANTNKLPYRDQKGLDSQ